MSAVCKEIDISRQSISRWLKEDPEFKKEYEECMSQGIENVNDLATSQTINHIKQGDIGMIKYWLSHNDPKFTKRPREVENDDHMFTSQERRVDFLDVGEAMLMKKVKQGDLKAIKYALQYNSGRYHPMRPSFPFLDMSDLSDPVVRNLVQEQLDSLSEKLQELTMLPLDEDEEID
ncbi:MAG: hypothetical protein KBD26_03150 [Candidatus Pacebacteria bacterium]|nr:hypothetical protein [Candidatus Paceibacterota bacterium]